jgi:hypothetical protein
MFISITFITGSLFVSLFLFPLELEGVEGSETGVAALCVTETKQSVPRFEVLKVRGGVKGQDLLKVREKDFSEYHFVHTYTCTCNVLLLQNLAFTPYSTVINIWARTILGQRVGYWK